MSAWWWVDIAVCVIGGGVTLLFTWRLLRELTAVSAARADLATIHSSLSAQGRLAENRPAGLRPLTRH
jgi:hypothetical protein